MSNIIVIGGSAAGMSFAAKYHRNRPQDNIILFESNDYISFGACGLPYYVQGQFDDKNEMFARTPKQMIESGIDVRTNTTVSRVDSANKCVYVGSEKFEYDKLIVATGANPIIPSFAAVDNDQVFTLTTMADGELLKQKLNSGVKHVTIIGAGFIGLEVMDAAKHLGLEVTVIEREDTILASQYGSDMSEIVSKHLVESNIDLRLSESVSAITKGERVLVETNISKIETDVVVLALGFRPNTAVIECDKLDNGAIIVDSKGQTSIDDIYAVGDCATTMNSQTGQSMYLPLATNANKFAKSLADDMCGIEHSFTGMIGSSCLKVLDYDMARTGMTESQLDKEKVAYKSKILKDKTHTSYFEGQEDIYIKLIYSPEDLKIYGAEIVGKKDVVHRLDVLALAITMGTTTKQLAYVDFAYAPPFARTWEALNTAGNISK